MVKTITNKKPKCPICKKNKQVVSNGTNPYGNKKYVCKTCKKSFTIRSAQK